MVNSALRATGLAIQLIATRTMAAWKGFANETNSPDSGSSHKDASLFASIVMPARHCDAAYSNATSTSLHAVVDMILREGRLTSIVVTFDENGGFFSRSAKMSDQRINEIDQWLEVAAQVLWRSFVAGFLLLLVWAGALLCCGDWIFQLHSKWFSLHEHEFAMIHYSGMAFVKLCLYLFFLFPFISIRLVLRKRRQSRA